MMRCGVECANGYWRLDDLWIGFGRWKKQLPMLGGRAIYLSPLGMVNGMNCGMNGRRHLGPKSHRKSQSPKRPFLPLLSWEKESRGRTSGRYRIPNPIAIGGMAYCS
jgi:hypothetical protein